MARFISDLLNRRAGVSSDVIDIVSLPLPIDDAGEAIKDHAFSAAMSAADGLVTVAPEYKARISEADLRALARIVDAVTVDTGINLPPEAPRRKLT